MGTPLSNFVLISCGVESSATSSPLFVYSPHVGDGVQGRTSSGLYIAQQYSLRPSPEGLAMLYGWCMSQSEAVCLVLVLCQHNRAADSFCHGPGTKSSHRSPIYVHTQCNEDPILHSLLGQLTPLTPNISFPACQHEPPVELSYSMNLLQSTTVAPLEVCVLVWAMFTVYW